MKLAGLDLSLTATGVAVIEDGKKLFSGVIRSHPAGKRPVDELERILDIVGRVEKILDTHMDAGEGLVVIENLAFMAKGNTLTQLSGLNYFVRKMCRDRGWRFALVAPLTLKKFVTGKGKGDKSVMMAEIHKRWGEAFLDDNEADAYALARAAAVFDPKTKATESTRHIYKLISSQIL